jgi:RecA-family ATPase
MSAALTPRLVNADDSHRGGVFSAGEFDGKSAPEREWCVRNYIPHRTVTLLGGDGGVGKTTLMLQLCAAKAIGTNWLGLDTRPGRTLFVSAEDDKDELHRRLLSIRHDMGKSWPDLTDVHLLPLAGEDAVMGRFNAHKTAMVPTPLFERLETIARDRMIDTIMLDTLSDVFAGDENNRQHARQFIGLLRGLALRTDTTILVASHPSLTGMQSGSGLSGSTAWNNTVRSRLYLSTKDRDQDVRTLQVRKANYGPSNLSVELRWQCGVYVPIDQAAVESETKHSADAAEECFMRLLDAYCQSASKFDPRSASNFDPLERRARTVALAPSELVGVAETGRARVCV